MFEWITLSALKVLRIDYMPKVGSEWHFANAVSKDPFKKKPLTYIVIEVKGDYVKYSYEGGREDSFSSSHVTHFLINYKEAQDV